MNKLALLITATIFTNMPIEHVQENPIKQKTCTKVPDNQRKISPYQSKHRQQGQRQFFKEILKRLNIVIALDDIPLEIQIFIDEMYIAAWYTHDTSTVEAMLKSGTIDVNYVVKLYPHNPNRDMPLISFALEMIYSANVELMIKYGSKDNPPLNVNAKTWLPYSDISKDETGTPLEFALQMKDEIDPNWRPDLYLDAQKNIDMIKAAGGHM